MVAKIYFFETELQLFSTEFVMFGSFRYFFALHLLDKRFFAEDLAALDLEAHQIGYRAR